MVRSVWALLDPVIFTRLMIDEMSVAKLWLSEVSKVLSNDEFIRVLVTPKFSHCKVMSHDSFCQVENLDCQKENMKHNPTMGLAKQ